MYFIISKQQYDELQKETYANARSSHKFTSRYFTPFSPIFVIYKNSSRRIYVLINNREHPAKLCEYITPNTNIAFKMDTTFISRFKDMLRDTSYYKMYVKVNDMYKGGLSYIADGHPLEIKLVDKDDNITGYANLQNDDNFELCFG